MTTAEYCEIWSKTDKPCDRPTCAICVAKRSSTVDTKPTNPKDAVGIKKMPMSVLSMQVIGEMGVGMMEGALKYGRHNWRKTGVRASVYFDGGMRHFMDWFEGQDIDPASGLNHITKLLTDLHVLRDSMLQGNWVDDRPPRATQPDWLEQLNAKAAALINKYPNPKEAITQLGLYAEQKQKADVDLLAQAMKIVADPEHRKIHPDGYCPRRPDQPVCICGTPEATATCCVCGKTGLSTAEGDGGEECQLTDGRWTCSEACWEKAADACEDPLQERVREHDWSKWHPSKLGSAKKAQVTTPTPDPIEPGRLCVHRVPWGRPCSLCPPGAQVPLQEHVAPKVTGPRTVTLDGLQVTTRPLTPSLDPKFCQCTGWTSGQSPSCPACQKPRQYAAVGPPDPPPKPPGNKVG